MKDLSGDSVELISLESIRVLVTGSNEIKLLYENTMGALFVYEMVCEHLNQTKPKPKPRPLLRLPPLPFPVTRPQRLFCAPEISIG